jgi:hypothetical protein
MLEVPKYPHLSSGLQKDRRKEGRKRKEEEKEKENGQGKRGR